MSKPLRLDELEVESFPSTVTPSFDGAADSIPTCNSCPRPCTHEASYCICLAE